MKDSLLRFAIPSLVLAGLLAAFAAGSAVAADKAPWLLTSEEAAPFANNQAAAAQGLVTVNSNANAADARPSDESLARMRQELADLKAGQAALPPDEFGLPPADAAIYAEAVELQLKIDIWPANFEANAFTCLKWGRAVTAGLKADPDFMRTVRHLAPLGYRSRVDRSAQPYLVALPDDFDPAAPGHRMVVLLHGAYALACPMGTISGALSRAKDMNPGAITVTPFGRANGGYEWAAETDVWDVIADMKRRYSIDENKIVLTGFSMGGGGTVKLGLTHPGPFAAAAALAPAAPTLGTMPAARDLTTRLSPFEPLSEAEIAERVGRVYPGPALAENGFGMPWMLGCGGEDRLLRVQEAVSKAFDEAGVKYSSFVVPGVGHGGDTVMRQPEYRPFLLAHVRDPAPREVTFATATLKSPGRAWVTIEALTAHYAKSLIHAAADPENGTLTVTTDGIERFTLTPPVSLIPSGRAVVIVDGERIDATAGGLTFAKAGGKWQRTTAALPALSKRAGLQGPVADAFTRGFLCVRPTGPAWNEAPNVHALAMLEALRLQWRTQAFGELPVKDDKDVTAADRAQYDLILFGDPGSNRLIAEALAAKSPWPLPLRWSRMAVGLDHYEHNIYPASNSLPVLIYPSPFQSGRYVVFNGTPLIRRIGMNRRDDPNADSPLRAPPAAFGDFAILQVERDESGGTTAKSGLRGFFNEQWQ